MCLISGNKSGTDKFITPCEVVIIRYSKDKSAKTRWQICCCLVVLLMQEEPDRGVLGLRWNGTLYMDQKSLFKFGEKRPIVRTYEQKMNFEGFTQNGCYGNQPQPFEVVFCSTDANTSCSFTKQDLTVN